MMRDVLKITSGFLAGVSITVLMVWITLRITIVSEPDPLYLYRITLLDGDTLEVVGDEARRGKGERNHYVSIYRNGEEIARVNQPYWVSWERLPLLSDPIVIEEVEGGLTLTPSSGAIVIEDDDPDTFDIHRQLQIAGNGL